MMTQINERRRAAIKAQRLQQASHEFHFAFGRPLMVHTQGSNQRHIPIVEAHAIQDYGQTPSQIPIVGMSTGFTANPERSQPITFMGDDQTVRIYSYEGNTRGSSSSQLEGTGRQDMAMAPFDVVNSDWESIRREDASLPDSLREFDLSGVQSTTVMNPYGLSRESQEILLANEELTQDLFEAFYVSPAPKLNLIFPYRKFFHGIRPTPEAGSEATLAGFGLSSPQLATRGWPSLPESADELRPAILEDEKVFLVSLLTIRGRKDVADRIQQYLDIVADEPDEPPVAMESLRSVVSFIAQQAKLAPPIVGSDPQGFMELEWHLKDNGDPNSVWGRGNGVVSMKFLGSGKIQYVALSGPYRPGIERAEKQDESTKEEIMDSLGMFAHRITTE